METTKKIFWTARPKGARYFYMGIKRCYLRDLSCTLLNINARLFNFSYK